MADIQTEIDIELIKRRAVTGVVTFTLRTLFVQLFTFIATFILTILLEPTTFGIFFVVSAFINLFVYFSDIGLAAALIQKKEKPDQEDFKTTFTLQQSIVMVLVACGLILSPHIAAFYKLDEQGLFLIRALLLSLILSSLKTIPTIIMERNLNFTKLVIPQVIENLTFYAAAVLLAMNGFGITSFSWAVILRGILGLLTVYILSPWKISVGLNKESLKELTRFGIPFQINSILALLKDDLLTVFLGKILTFSQVGYIGWAQKWAFIPLRFFMDNVNKITFPAYSRLQEHKEELEKAIGKSIFFVTYLVYPAVFGMAAVAPGVINLVPSYEKWQPALPLLYLFGINAIFSSVSTTFTNTLFAIGKPKIVLNLMAFWTALTWGLTIPLTLKFGYIGAGLASALVATTSSVTVFFVKRELNVSVTKNVFGPLLLSIIIFIIARSMVTFLPGNNISLVFTILLSAIIYFVLSIRLFGDHLKKDLSTVVKAFFTK